MSLLDISLGHWLMSRCYDAFLHFHMITTTSYGWLFFSFSPRHYIDYTPLLILLYWFRQAFTVAIITPLFIISATLVYNIATLAAITLRWAPLMAITPLIHMLILLYYYEAFLSFLFSLHYTHCHYCCHWCHWWYWYTLRHWYAGITLTLPLLRCWLPQYWPLRLAAPASYAIDVIFIIAYLRQSAIDGCHTWYILIVSYVILSLMSLHILPLLLQLDIGWLLITAFAITQ